MSSLLETVFAKVRERLMVNKQERQKFHMEESKKLNNMEVILTEGFLSISRQMMG
jgi:hypothetical protein